MESNQSNLEIGIELIQIEENAEKKLQRTEAWQEERRGNWTGSQFKNLMACSSSGGKMDWTDKEKIFRFSDGSIKYIFANAMERKTGRYITTGTTKEMEYGTKIEPLIQRRFKEYLNKIGFDYKEVGYKKFDNVPSAGVSSDGIVVQYQSKEKIIASAEFKACSSWTTLFERTYEFMDETGKDFWQTQGQMEAWQVDENYYVVISPPGNIKDYLYADNVMELYEKWINETEMHVQIVKKSPIHCRALINRIKIAESTVERFLAESDSKLTLKQLLYEEIEWAQEQAKDVNPETIKIAMEALEIEPEKEKILVEKDGTTPPRVNIFAKKNAEKKEIEESKIREEEDFSPFEEAIAETSAKQETAIPEKGTEEADMDDLPF
jgi:hypothetical protein